MKKRVLLLVAALTAASLWMQGCSKPAEKEPTTVEETKEEKEEEKTEEETEEETEEATTEEAAEEAEEEASEVADEASATGIPAEYEKYLSWTATEYDGASDDEKKEAIIAYVLYDGIIYQGVEDLTAEDVKNEPEMDAMLSMVENSIYAMPDRTLQEICDLGHSATQSIDDIELPAEVKATLQSCTEDSWNAASDEEKMEIAKAMVYAVGMMAGQEVTMEMLNDPSMEAGLEQQVVTIQSLYDTGLYGEDNLYDILGSV